MKWLEIAYEYFWYYSQVFVKKTHLRRPFTFVMRDHPWLFWLIVTPTFGFIVYISRYRWELITGGIWFMLFAHLWWGSKIIPAQQEEPPFDPLHPIRTITERRNNRARRNHEH